MFQDPTSRLTVVFSDSFGHDGQPPGMEVRQYIARSPSPKRSGRLRVIRSSSHGKRHTFSSFTCGLSAMTSSWPELKRVAAAGVFPLSKFPKEVQPRIQLGCFSYLNKKVDSTDIKASVYCMILFYICVCNSMAMYLFLSNLELLKMKQ